jgi:hypothetical protein
MMKLIVAFCNFAKTPEMGYVNGQFAHSRVIIIQKPHQRWRGTEVEKENTG